MCVLRANRPCARARACSVGVAYAAAKTATDYCAGVGGDCIGLVRDEIFTGAMRTAEITGARAQRCARWAAPTAGPSRRAVTTKESVEERIDRALALSALARPSENWCVVAGFGSAADRSRRASAPGRCLAPADGEPTSRWPVTRKAPGERRGARRRTCANAAAARMAAYYACAKVRLFIRLAFG